MAVYVDARIARSVSSRESAAPPKPSSSSAPSSAGSTAHPREWSTSRGVLPTRGARETKRCPLEKRVGTAGAAAAAVASAPAAAVAAVAA
eukprot:3501282-Prymnesium_polylepis.2